MTDVVISGDVAVRKAPEPIEVQMPAPIAGPERLPEPDGDIRLKRISGEPIELDTEGKALRAEIPERPDDPIYEWKAGALPEAGEHENFSKQIKRASESMYSARMAALGEDYSRLPTVTPEGGREIAEAVVNAAPTKIVPVGDTGLPIQPLRDDEPIRELDAFQTRGELKRGMSQFRDLQDRQRAQLLQDLQAAEAQQAASREAEQTRQAQPAAPPQPDINQERARLQAQQHQVQAQQYWNQLGAAEQAAANEIAQLEQWTQANYHPQELQNPHLIRDAERAHWLEQGAARYRELDQGLRNASTVRAAAQTQAAAAYRQNVKAWGERQNDIFQSELKTRHPQLYANQRKMQDAAKSYLARTTGLTQEQLTAEWNRGRWRSAPEQMIIADAVGHEMARESMRGLNSKRAHTPPVSSYASRPRGAGDMDRVRDLERDLESAPNSNAALRIATKLHQARRDAGLV